VPHRVRTDIRLNVIHRSIYKTGVSS
jgi:hypothetical protein